MARRKREIKRKRRVVKGVRETNGTIVTELMPREAT